MMTSFFNRGGRATVIRALFVVGCLAMLLCGALPVRAQKAPVTFDRPGVTGKTDGLPSYQNLISRRTNAPVSTNAANGTTYNITFDAGDAIGGLGAGSYLGGQYTATTGATFFPNAFSGTGPTTQWASNTSMQIFTLFPELAGTPGPGVTPVTGNSLHSPQEYNFENGDPSMLVTFEIPVSTFGATFGALTQSLLATRLVAYAANGDILAIVTQASPQDGGNQQRLVVSSETPIAAVAIVPGTYIDYVLVDDISFTTVGGAPPQAVNEQVSFTTTTQGMTGIEGSCASAGYTNLYSLNVNLTNIGTNMLANPYFQVLELQESTGAAPVNPFRLQTATDFKTVDCTGGLIGTTQAIPGPIAPGQVIPVNFQIAMPQLRRFRFFVGVYAVVGGGLPPRSTARRLGKLAVEATGFDPAGNPVLTATFIPEKGMPTLNVTGVKATLAR